MKERKFWRCVAQNSSGWRSTLSNHRLGLSLIAKGASCEYVVIAEMRGAEIRSLSQGPIAQPSTSSRIWRKGREHRTVKIILSAVSCLKMRHIMLITRTSHSWKGVHGERNVE